MRFYCFALVCALGFFSCALEQDSKSSNHNTAIKKIFKQLSAEDSGIQFNNTLKEDSIINYFTYPYIYMGGGVAIGDLNNDGLADIYFSANMVDNRLYLNKGDMKFDDVTQLAGVRSDERWATGITMADVNADGWLDIYLSVSGKFATTKNQLFINQGIDENGIPTFKEEATLRGVDDEGQTTQGSFFDYDKDGDLDLYIANYPFTSFKTPNYAYKLAVDKKDPAKSDRLFSNDGKGYFKDVTKEAGLLNFGLSLSATVADFNADGWEDIYVSNDFASPDFFYFNNGDGSFTDRSKETTQHTAFFGMGSDVGDINNDALPDLLQVDMTPESNRRNKANMASMDMPRFWEVVNLDMHYQYMQNALQVNNGIAKNKLPHFSDLSRITGMSSTDWSWAGLFADFDNDGWQDVFISNGTRRDINNKDYFEKIEKANYQEKQKQTKLGLTLNMPSEKVDNYMYRNNGDLSFDKVSEDWGVNFEGFSNGAAYGDLDNDGDLDLVVSNIDDPASVFENLTQDLDLANYLKIKLVGPILNPNGLGTKILLKSNSTLQYRQQTLTRGFQSSVDPIVHFGLANITTIDSLIVKWTDGREQRLSNIPTNHTLELKYENAEKSTLGFPIFDTAPQLFADKTEESGIDFKHVENPHDDFKNEVLIPHSYSKNGPGLATGDINGDGLEDFYIGGAVGQSGAIFIQTQNSIFKKSSQASFKKESNQEDMDASFFDADQDGDLDLYVVSGGNESKKNSPRYQDRLYVNDGTGNFSRSKNSLPKMFTSGSRVKAGDFDKDGDLDLFVGGRILPQEYPLPAKSYLLRNEGVQNGFPQFADVTATLAPDLLEAGLVTDATWTDYNNDDKLDLLVVGEWMPPTFLKNTGKEFTNATEDLGMNKKTGWWYSVHSDDFDNDGDQDFVLGNLGLNYKYQASDDETFDVYASDYDKNGTLDIVLGYYNEGVQYPVRGRQCSSEQIPTIKYKYKDYNSFADASLINIYTKEDLEAGLHYEARTFASVYLENVNGKEFKLSQLPNEAQLSSVNGIVTDDLNEDGHLDIVLGGNLFGSEIETTRNDASYGCVLMGDGNGIFKPLTYAESGLKLGGDVKAMKKIKTKDGIALLVGNNSTAVQLIQHNSKKK